MLGNHWLKGNLHNSLPDLPRTIESPILYSKPDGLSCVAGECKNKLLALWAPLVSHPESSAAGDWVI